MSVLITIGIIVFFIGGILLYFQLNGGLGFPWLAFYAKGKESGFSFGEISLLRKAAVDTRLDNPTSLFWSVRQLDKTIKNYILKVRAEGKEDDPKTVHFISNLYDFRKRVEFNSPKYKAGIKSTREIVASQKVRINLAGSGASYVSSVVEPGRKYLALSYPQGPALPPGFSWKGQKVNVYFWRAEDAGYFFESKVIDDYLDRRYPLIHVAHSDNVVRSQKRRSIRCEVNIGANIYNLPSIDSANETLERTPGLRARMVDISEDGCALLVGGKAKVGLPLKIQFTLTDHPLVMCGIIKGISFDQTKNRSLLHIQAVPPSLKIRNKILSYVYNIFEERKEIKKRISYS